MGLIPTWAKFCVIVESPDISIFFFKSEEKAIAKDSELTISGDNPWITELVSVEVLRNRINAVHFTTHSPTDIVPAPKQARYHTNGDGSKDFIDESYETDSFEQFTAAIFWTIRKYMKRFGKKDDIESESRKIMDYATRFHQKVIQHKEETEK